MSDVLDRILDAKREHVARRRRERPLGEIERDLPTAPPRGFARALRATHAGGSLALIAEIKRASPSRGLIREDFDPATHARDYRAGGATCLSILTDTPFFGGEDDHLRAARAAVDLPCLRKDFVIDPYQVVEARAIGADCILLIMAALDDARAKDLAATAEGLGLDVLAEVHDRHELDRALGLDGEPMLGINNRNLKTLQVDLCTTEELAGAVPAGRLLVSESGLATRDDLVRMRDRGAHAFLVGERLMAERDLKGATRRLLEGDGAR